MVVKGVPTIRRAIINIKDGNDHRGKKGDKELLVEGYGLQKVMTTQGIVGEQTTSNHVIEVAQVLGIEAARKTIINEINYTMKSHGMSIDPRHVMLLGDVMSYKVCHMRLVGDIHVTLMPNCSTGRSPRYHAVRCSKDEGQRTHVGVLRKDNGSSVRRLSVRQDRRYRWRF